ncbi:MAG: anaerobic ribonucleoside-triphosphate reductase activating protein [bacterium]
MRVVGLTPTSLVDWDGCVSAVLFLGGCNLRCPFCYNGDLARDDPGLEEVPWQRVEPVLARRPGFLDGAVLLGGEPMMHPEVFDLARRIKALGLRVKVDTNGCFPYPLKRLIEQGLCDFVAMDVKAPLGPGYRRAAGADIDLAVIRRSIRLLLESGVDCEFRTTLVPGLVGPGEIEEIGPAIRGARRWTLQGYIPDNAAAESFRDLPPTGRADAEAMAARAAPFAAEVKLRGKFR